MKDQRGGAGRSQGRHKVLKPWQQMDVAAEFERLWQEEAKTKAWKKYRAASDNGRVEEEVEKLQQAYSEQRERYVDRLREIKQQLRGARKKGDQRAEKWLRENFEKVAKLFEKRQREISQKIDEVTKGRRRLSLPLKQPKGKLKAVADLAIKYAREKYAKNDKGEIDEKKAKAITARRVADWVIKYRNLVRDNHSGSVVMSDMELESLAEAGYGPME
jgi:hypothetical protein